MQPVTMEQQREALVGKLASKGIGSERVLDAMRAVERERFVPPEHAGSAYRDRPLPIGEGQTISQPYIVALMTEHLRVRPQDRVLEIGAGSGYQSAVLARLTPHVFSVERRAELVEMARANLADAGCDTVCIRHADGYGGWPDRAPFDKIIITASVVHIPPPLIAQLAAGGRMVAPVGGRDEVQSLELLLKDARGVVTARTLESVRFVPMVGRAQNGSPSSASSTEDAG